MAWEYRIEQHSITERWGTKRQAREFETFVTQLNELGIEDWELIHFQPVPITGAWSGDVKGYAYLTFWKREAPV